MTHQKFEVCLLAGKGTAAGARATAQAKRAQQGSLFNIPEQNKPDIPTAPALTGRQAKRGSDSQPGVDDDATALSASSPASGSANRKLPLKFGMSPTPTQDQQQVQRC